MNYLLVLILVQAAILYPDNSGQIGNPITITDGIPITTVGPGVTTISPLDMTAPIAGNNGLVTPLNLTPSSVTLNWTLATDPDDIQSSLLYEVCRSTVSISSCRSGATIIRTFTPNIQRFSVTGLSPRTTYYFMVMVSDIAGNVSAYRLVSVTTPRRRRWWQ